MDNAAMANARAFTARVEFLSGDDLFGTERFRIEAADASVAHAMARAQAEASAYANERIPNLRLIITIAPAPDDEHSPSNSGAASPG